MFPTLMSSLPRSRRNLIALWQIDATKPENGSCQVSVISCQWRLAFRSAEPENNRHKENTGSHLAISQSGFPVGPGLFPIGDH
jgi:hypothetical protein